MTSCWPLASSLARGPSGFLEINLCNAQYTSGCNVYKGGGIWRNSLHWLLRHWGQEGPVEVLSLGQEEFWSEGQMPDKQFISSVDLQKEAKTFCSFLFQSALILLHLEKCHFWGSQRLQSPTIPAAWQHTGAKGLARRDIHCKFFQTEYSTFGISNTWYIVGVSKMEPGQRFMGALFAMRKE